MTRKTWAIIFLVIATIITPFAIIAIWFNNTLLNTNRYVATVAPLSKNEAIASDLANRLADRVFNQVPVQEQISTAIPANFQFLAPVLTQELQNLFVRLAQSVITSDQFNQTWISLNRVAHEQIVAILTGQRKAVTVEDSQVTLNLQVVLDQVKARLAERGVTLLQNVTLSPENSQIVLFQSQALVQIQGFLNLLTTLRIVLPLLMLLFFAGAVILYPNHARGLFWTGIGLLIAGIVLIITIALFRSSFPSYTPNLSAAASLAFYDTIIRYLQTAAWFTVGIGVVLAIIFFFVDRREAKS